MPISLQNCSSTLPSDTTFDLSPVPIESPIRSSMPQIVPPHQSHWQYISPGLSPLFHTDNLSVFHAFLNTLTSSSPSNSSDLDPTYAPHVIPIAISYPNSSRPFAPFPSTLRAQLASQVPTVVTKLGFRSFHIWIDIIHTSRQTRHSAPSLFRQRILPFLCLPVLRLAGPPTEAHRANLRVEFQDRVEHLAACLGQGMVSVQHSTSTLRPTVLFWPRDTPRCDGLDDRFRTFLFTMVATQMLDDPDVDSDWCRLARAAAEAVFATAESVVGLQPVRAIFLPDDARWTEENNGGWLGEWEWVRALRSVSVSGKDYTLGDASEPFLRLNTYIAIRRLQVIEQDGVREWIVFCKDYDIPGVALAVVLKHGKVCRRCVFGLDDPSDFLDLTHEIETTFDNEALKVAVGDVLREQRVFCRGERVQDAEIVLLDDEGMIVVMDTRSVS